MITDPILSSSTITLPSHTPRKEVRRGVFQRRSNLTCVVWDEGSLIWLPALRLWQWRSIKLVTVESGHDINPSHLLFREAILKHFGKKITKVSPSAVYQLIPGIDVILVSGSISFLNNLLPSFEAFLSTTAVIAVVGTPVKRRFQKPQVEQYTWNLRSHQQYGGVTQARVLVGISNGATPVEVDYKLRRSVKDIISYGLPVEPVEPNPSFEHYRPLDLLSIGKLLKPVVYASHRSRTQWGSRPLSGGEIRAAFNLPAWLIKEMDSVAVDTGLFECLLPVSILSFALDSVFPSVQEGKLLLPLVPASNSVIPPVKPSTTSPAGDYLPALDRFLPATWCDAVYVSVKAVKADDADIEYAMWNLRIQLLWPQCLDRHLTVLRDFALRINFRIQFKSFIRYCVRTHGVDWLSRLEVLRSRLPLQLHWGDYEVEKFRSLEQISKREQELLVDAYCGINALQQNLSATWWEWNSGSALAFWLWTTEPIQTKYAREGMEVYVKSKLPHFWDHQAKPKPEDLELMAAKLAKVIDRNYITPGDVANLTEVFSVKKGENDIRLVYNGTKCGANAVLWAPSFGIPCAASAVRVISFCSFMLDLDMAEMFLNFPMPFLLRRFSGVDLTPFAGAIEKLLGRSFELNEQGRLILRWARAYMGNTKCPYYAVRFYCLAEEVAKGNPDVESNPFHYSEVKLNLPGSSEFDPSLPWAFKWNSAIKQIAADILTYIDDGRLSASSRELSWRAKTSFVSRLQRLGIQDAPRKTRPPSKTPGAWAGTIFKATDDTITQSTTQEKWDKGKVIIAKLALRLLGDDQPLLDFKELQSEVGFLNHLALTYGFITPYLRPFCQTLYGWLPNRDKEGLKNRNFDWQNYVLDQVAEGNLSIKEALILDEAPWKQPPPLNVKAVPSFKLAIESLAVLVTPSTPPLMMIRSTRILSVRIAFGDASAGGNGFTEADLKGVKVEVREGVWGEEMKGKFAHSFEMLNFVEKLEEDGRAGKLNSAMLFLCTDNKTVEAAFANGSSRNPEIHGYIIRIKMLEIKFGVIMFVSHVSGTRMIDQGTDAVSRGIRDEGVLGGAHMLYYFPFHLSALERSPEVRNWVKTWATEKVEFLEPIDWFRRGHDWLGGSIHEDGLWRPNIEAGIFVWSPPPTAADLALEELRKARLKRHNSTHIVICPLLMSPMWKRQLHKVADLVFYVPAGCSFWPESMFEPLLIGIVFPMFRLCPWQFKGTPKMLAMGRQLSKVWKTKRVDEGNLLRKLCEECWRMDSLPRDVVRKLLYFGQ